MLWSLKFVFDTESEFQWKDFWLFDNYQTIDNERIGDVCQIKKKCKAYHSYKTPKPMVSVCTKKLVYLGRNSD